MFEVWWKITEEMNMKKLLTIFLLLFSINGYCEWTRVGNSEDKDITIYIDKSTIKRVGGYIRVWSLWDMQKPNNKMLSMMSLEEYDCSNEKKRVIQLAGYTGRMAGGNSVGTQQGDNNWSFVAPGTVGTNIHNEVCKNKI